VNNKLPQKLYYSISELSQIIDEEQYVLRYWEREFAEIKPRKNRAGNRAYTSSDIAIIQLIRKLLREEQLTIQKAKDKLKTMNLNLIEGYQPAVVVPEISVQEQRENVVAEPRNPVKRVKAISDLDGLLENVESATAKPKKKQSSMVSLRRQDVLELCKLLKDMAYLIQYM
jgi:DNA-binding transcriptional MerR regulator